MDKETTNAQIQSQQTLTRRQMLKTVAGAGMVALLPMLVETAQADTPPTAPAQWTDVGKADQFTTDVPQRVTLAGGGVLFVTRNSADTLTALSAKCTHQGCEIGWDKSGSQFLCPCHGATFTTSGQTVNGPARRPLVSVPAMQKDGEVQVNLQGIAPEDLQPRHRGGQGRPMD